MNASQRRLAWNEALEFMLAHDRAGFVCDTLEQGVLVRSYNRGVFLFDGQSNRQTLLAGKPLDNVRSDL